MTAYSPNSEIHVDGLAPCSVAILQADLYLSFSLFLLRSEPTATLCGAENAFLTERKNMTVRKQKMVSLTFLDLRPFLY